MAFEQRSLEDYIDVAQRIADFRERYPDGTLQPYTRGEPFRLVQAMGWEKDGTQVMQSFVVVVAAAYRDRDDPNPGVGMAWEIFPGRTNFTRGSELQNAETSAWGRAIIAVGASDSKRGIASREEVRNRQAEREQPHTHPVEGMGLFVVGCPACLANLPAPRDPAKYCLKVSPSGLFECAMKPQHDGLHDWELPRNADGSLSRSRTSDAEKAAAGVMTDAEQRAHNQLAKPPPNTGKVTRLVPCDDPDCNNTVHTHHKVPVDAAVDDRWTSEAPSWLVGVDPPEDQPGSILPAQRSQIMAVYTALGIKDRDKRVADMNSTLVHLDLLRADQPQYTTTNDLSHQQAARLLENLHERHTGKMTHR